jgi:hypothetical protein
METILIEKSGNNDTDFDNITWVLKARSKDKHKVNLAGVFIDGGLLVCTDGHRLHCYMTTRELASGNYDVKSATKKQIILQKNDYQFPQYEKVFPKNMAFCQPFYCNGQKFRFLHVVYKNYTIDNETFNDDFLNDVYMENSEVMIAKEINLSFSPLIIFDGDYKAALIMPCKFNS